MMVRTLMEALGVAVVLAMISFLLGFGIGGFDDAKFYAMSAALIGFACTVIRGYYLTVTGRR